MLTDGQQSTREWSATSTRGQAEASIRIAVVRCEPGPKYRWGDRCAGASGPARYACNQSCLQERHLRLGPRTTACLPRQRDRLSRSLELSRGSSVKS
jgi:hypothetical protein